MTGADVVAFYRPLCGCDVCRRRRGGASARPAKRRYYPCETRIIILEMRRDGSTRQEMAAVLGVTVSGVKLMLRALDQEGHDVYGKRQRRTRTSDAAPEIARRLRAGERIADVSRAVGFDVRNAIHRARSGRGTRPADRLIAAAAGPAMPCGERLKRWHAVRLGSC